MEQAFEVTREVISKRRIAFLRYLGRDSRLNNLGNRLSNRYDRTDNMQYIQAQ